MNTQTIDQTQSEVQLHRALYILISLRAALVHNFLLLAAVLLFLAGIENVYPLADNLIRSLRVQLTGIQTEMRTTGVVMFWIFVVFAIAMYFVLMIWMYRSIINLRRVPLKVLAVWLFLWAILYLPGEWTNLDFAFHNLSFGFAVLATIGTTMVFFIIPVYGGMVLWRISRLKEGSSLRATLDPRLAPNWWIYLNKLLGLPCTPFRTVRTAGAYVIALAGTLLLVACVTYLFAVGGVTSELTTLAKVCNERVMPECFAKSASLAARASVLLVLAVIGIKVAGLLHSTARRLGGLSVSDVITKADERFILYLRPFDADDVILPKPRLPLLSRLFFFAPLPARIEQELFAVTDGYRPLIAVGKPGEDNRQGGVAYRAYLDDSKWQDYVAAQIRAADRIVMVLKNTDGVRWEFERVMGEGAAPKTLFLFDPAMEKAAEREQLRRMVTPLLEGEKVAADDFDMSEPLIGFFLENGRLVKIINANRSATSYRTAFSYFLTESRQLL